MHTSEGRGGLRKPVGRRGRRPRLDRDWGSRVSQGFLPVVSAVPSMAMNVSLSDLLTCPRCGPTHGLILLPMEVVDRRVRSGVLGCANCRERYRVEEYVADLRTAGERAPAFVASPGPRSEAERDEAAVRLAALLGLADASGSVLLAGPAAVHAAGVAKLVPDVTVMAVDAPVADNISCLRVDTALPLRSGSLAGVALTGGRAALLEEGARLLGSAGRLLLDPVPADARSRLAGGGVRVVAEEAGTLVAVRGS